MNTAIMPKGTYGVLSSYLHTARSAAVAKYIVDSEVVLDVGCGTGDFEAFLPKTVRYYGIDVRKLWPNSKKNLFVCGIGDTLPKKINHVTCVTSLAVIEHLVNPLQFFQFAASTLPAQGLVIVTTPHPISRKVHDYGAVLGLFSRHASEDHERFLDVGDLTVLGARTGLTLVHYQRFLFGMNQLAVYVKSST